MPTSFSQNLQPSNSTDAFFRLWTKWVRDAFVAGGWVQTADTGQINFATVTHPVASSTAQGFAILRMADTLQSVYPVYLRLDFGSSPGGANNPAIWFTLGAGTDGAGTITPAWFLSPTASAAPLQAGGSSTVLDPVYSFASADTRRCHLGLFVQPATTSTTMVFSIERTKDAGGNDTGDGVVLYWTQTGTLNRNQYLFAQAVQQPTTEQGLAAVLSTLSPSALSQDIGMALPFPFAGPSQQPVSGVLLGKQGDNTSDAYVKAFVYGALIPYQRLFTTTTDVNGRSVFLRAD